MKMARARAALQAALLALALTACGGGGGGGGSPPAEPPPAQPQPALALTPLNHRFVLDDGLRLADMLLSLAQHAVDRVDEMARIGPLPRRLRRCSSGEGDLVDNDGNRAISPGDRVLLTYPGCSEGTSGASIVGRMQIEVLERSADGLSTRGRISWPDGLDWDASASPVPGRGRWLGGFGFERRREAGRTVWRASVAASDNLRFTWREGTASFEDRIPAAEVQRELRHATARVAWSVALEVDSPRRGGRYTLATTQPMVAAVESTPDHDEGPARLELRGAGPALVWVEPAPQSTRNAHIAFDAQGDGSPDTSAQLEWSLVLSGVGWHAAFGERQFPLDERRPKGFTTLTNYSGTAQPHLPLQLLFTRPLAAGVQPRFKLFDTGRLDLPLLSTPVELPVDVQRDGTLFVLSPRTQPTDSTRLELRVSLSDTFSTFERVRIEAADGQALEHVDGRMASFHTSDLLRPAISGVASRQTLLPGESLALSGANSVDPGWITEYRWAASGGMPLVLSTPGAVGTSLRLGPGGVGIGYATVELTVRNALGQSATSAVRVKTVNPGPSQWLLAVNSEPGDYIGEGRRDWFSEAIGRFTLFQSGQPGAISIAYDELGASASLQLRSADGGPLQVGRYADAGSSGGAGRPALGLSMDSRGCEVAGSFEVLEVAYDGQGVLQQLAVNFEQRCLQGLPPIGTLHGALRFNSSLPLPG